MKHKLFTLLFAMMAGVGSVFAQITIDGNFSDWEQVPSAQLAETTGTSDFVAYGAKFCTDAENLYFYVEYDGDMTMDISIYMNTDGDAATGFISGLGLDYLVDGWVEGGVPEFSVATHTNPDAQDDWNFESIDGVDVSACNAVVLPNGHSAIEGSLLLETLPTDVTALQVRVSVMDGDWGEYPLPEDGSVLDVPFGTAEISTSGACGDNLTWTLSEGVLTISGTGAMTSNPWRPSRNDIQTIVMSEGITEIKDNAFADCVNLTTVNIPSSVTYIGDDAFKACASLPIVNNMRMADTYLVEVIDKSLSSYTIPEGVLWIGTNAFNGCNVLSMTIPDEILGIGSNAFAGIINVSYNGTAAGTPWGALVHNGYVDGWLVYSNSSKTELLLCWPDAAGEIVLPEGLLSIADYAFYGCANITGINIPSSVTYIGEAAFSECTGLPVIDNIRYADTYLIEAVDKSQTSYTIQPGTKWIANYAFSYCSTPSITIPDEVEYIADWAFSGVMNVVYHGTATGEPWGATMLNGFIDGWLVYSDGNKTELISCSQDAEGEIVLPEGLLSIADYAFSGCVNITAINIPSSVTHIGSYAFNYCYGLPVGEDMLRYADTYLIEALDQSATSYVIREGTKWIGDGAFNMWFDNMTSVTIPNSVIRIGEYAFSSADQLNTITIPASVTSIGQAAFAYCYNLSSITCEAVTPPVCDEGWTAVFDGVSKSIPVFVPGESVEAYQAAEQWKDFTNIRRNYFIVKFVDWDGTELSEQHIQYGQPATAPEIPTREGYYFTGWDYAFDAIYMDLTISAQYGIQSYAVTFYDYYGNFLKFEMVEWHNSATAPETPVLDGATFLGWDKDIDDVTSDLNVRPLYSFLQYTVTFLDWDDTELKTETVDWMSAATAPVDPVREGYTFTGWDKSFSSVTTDLTVKAQYSINQYSVVFYDWNDSYLTSEFVEWHGAATAPEDPVREGYTFSGWDHNFADVTSNLVIKAQYTINQFTVIFLDWDDTELKRETVDWLNSAIAPEVPGREGYTFVGWDNSPYNITADVTLKAQYSINLYDVFFVGYDGTLIMNTTLPHGTDVIPPVAPVRAGYAFTGWSGNLENITGRVISVAQYVPEVPVYTVTFVDWDDSNITSIEVESHRAASAPQAPVHQGYTFTGWDKAFNDVTSDITVKAQYLINLYDVFFIDYDGTVITSVSVPHDQAATAPVAPVRDGYVFTGWSADFEHVVGTMFAVALYEPETPVYTHTVTYEDKDGGVITTEEVKLNMPTAPMYDGFTFLGWMTVEGDATAGIVIRAIYEQNTVPTSVDQTDTPSEAPHKVIVNGHVYILRGNKVYTIQGQEVK